MQVKIEKHGNSASLRLSKSLMQSLNIAIGDTLDATVEAGVLRLAPAQRRYKLEELIAQCNIKAPRSRESQEWLDAPRVGREKI
jgi:antitoxin ChpS